MSARIPWTELPQTVRRRVEAALGSPVVRATSQAGGFSPGSADRLVCEDGTRAFVKAVDGTAHPDSAPLHCKEAQVMGLLGPDVPAPRLLDSFEEEGWVVLVLEDIEGTHPAQDTVEEITAVLDALAALPRATGALLDLPRAEEDLVPESRAWQELEAAGLPEDLDPWVAQNLDRLKTLSPRLLEVVHGDHLAHTDLRPDNLLQDAAGKVWILDWPWAVVGNPLVDVLNYLASVLMRNPEHDVEQHLAHPVLAGTTAEDVDTALAALAGAFLHSSRQPAAPTMEHLRVFQRQEAEAVLGWLRRRWSAQSA